MPEHFARLAGAAVVVTDNLRHFGALLQHGIRVLDSEGMALELGIRGDPEETS